mgnify:CR=1 FL=1
MKKLSSMVLASAILGGTTLFGAGIATLESVKGTPASLDASDAAWAKAKEISVLLTETPYKPDGYKGMLKSTAVIKSLYDDKNILFLFLLSQNSELFLLSCQKPLALLWKKQCLRQSKKESPKPISARLNQTSPQLYRQPARQ